MQRKARTASVVGLGRAKRTKRAYRLAFQDVPVSHDSRLARQPVETIARDDACHD